MTKKETWYDRNGFPLACMDHPNRPPEQYWYQEYFLDGCAPTGNEPDDNSGWGPSDYQERYGEGPLDGVAALQRVPSMGWLDEWEEYNG